MKTNLFYDDRLEQVLIDWLDSQGEVAVAIANISQLSARLTQQVIEGRSEGAFLLGPVHVGGGSFLGPTAVIDGPAVIGTDTEIQPGVMISKGSLIGSRCKIGHGAYVERSIILDDAVIHPGAYIRNAIIGVGCVVGPRAVLNSWATIEDTKTHLGIPANTTVPALTIVSGT